MALLLLLQSLVAPAAAGACRSESCSIAIAGVTADGCDDGCSDDTRSGFVACSDAASVDACDGDAADGSSDRAADLPREAGCAGDATCDDLVDHSSCATHDDAAPICDGGSCDCCMAMAPMRLRPSLARAEQFIPPTFPPVTVASLLMLPRSVDHPPCRAI